MCAQRSHARSPISVICRQFPKTLLTLHCIRAELEPGAVASFRRFPVSAVVRRFAIGRRAADRPSHVTDAYALFRALFQSGGSVAPLRVASCIHENVRGVSERRIIVPVALCVVPAHCVQPKKPAKAVRARIQRRILHYRRYRTPLLPCRVSDASISCVYSQILTKREKESVFSHVANFISKFLVQRCQTNLANMVAGGKMVNSKLITSSTYM